MCLKGGDEEEWCEREGPHYDHQSPTPVGLSGSEEAAGGGCNLDTAKISRESDQVLIIGAR